MNKFLRFFVRLFYAIKFKIRKDLLVRKSGELLLIHTMNNDRMIIYEINGNVVIQGYDDNNQWTQLPSTAYSNEDYVAICMGSGKLKLSNLLK